MESVGLMPSTTAAPGGARVGQSVSHYVIERGPFDRAFKAMPRDYLLPWQSWEPTNQGKNKPPVSKIKYTCPTCAANVWGKPGLRLRCDACDTLLVSVAEAESLATAASA